MGGTGVLTPRGTWVYWERQKERLKLIHDPNRYAACQRRRDLTGLDGTRLDKPSQRYRPGVIDAGAFLCLEIGKLDLKWT